MPDPHRSSLKEFFAKALERRPEDRAAFLDEACAEDAALRARIEALLRADERKGQLEELTGPFSPGEGMPETTIGPYRLLELLGEGGFGSVYLAEQRSPVYRRVALKIIKPGMDSRQIIARFEAERQALALMGHPNIARVLDVGTTERGLPFFVMELVQGPPLTEYCDRRSLPVAARLRLFVSICRAIEHAHQKGVIHRDLKPSNILVEEQEDVPFPKVIDFGIAKAMTTPLTDRTLVTERTQLIGTPEYMSPEQAELGGLHLDTRSDVYALGILLYELLTGATPVDSSVLRSASLREMQRLICDTEPPKPSDRLRTSADDAATDRGAPDPREFRERRSMLRGALDWIVMKALEKERGRRYQSAAALADDIERHMTGQPVQAAPPSTTYRVRTFIRRHRVGVAATAIVVSAILVGAVTSFVFALREAHQRSLAEEASTAANTRAAELAKLTDDLQAVVDFQASMLGGLDAAGMGRAILEDLRAQIDLSLMESGLVVEDRSQRLDDLDDLLRRANATDLARDVIDGDMLREATAAIDRHFGDRPLVQATLLRSVGAIYLAMADHRTAETYLRRAYDRLRVLAGERHRETLLARYGLAVAAYYRSDLEVAARELESCLHDQTEAIGETHRDALATMVNVTLVLDERGRADEAMDLARRSAQLHEAALGLDDPLTVRAINMLSKMLIQRGHLDEADETTGRALDASAMLVRREQAVYALAGRAWLLGRTGRLPEALQLRREALREARAAFGSTHPATLEMLGWLGWTLQRIGAHAEAASLSREAATLLTRLLGPRHPRTLEARTTLGQALMNTGELREAERLLREVLDARRIEPGPDHITTLWTANMLGICLWHQERLDEADIVLRRAYETSLRTHGPEHSETVSLQANIAMVAWSRGDLERATELYRGVLVLQREQFGPDAEATLLTRGNLAGLAAEQGRYEEAAAELRPVLASLRAVCGDRHPNTLDPLMHLAMALRGLDALDEAERLLHEGLEVVAAPTDGAATKNRAELLSRLGAVLTDAGRHEEAEQALLEAVVLFEGLPTPLPSSTGLAIERLLALYEAWGRPEQAGPWRERLAAMRSR